MHKIADRHFFFHAKWFLFLPVLLLVFFATTLECAVGEDGDRISFVTKRGESIERAKILRIEPDGISVMHASGISKIPIEDLPDELRERFHLNASDASRFRTQQAAQIRAREERVREVMEQQREEQRRREEEKMAERKKQVQTKEEAKKVHANYTWHLGRETFVGRVILVQDNKVLIQIANREGRTGRRLCALDDLPLSERERAIWIGKRLTPADRARGEPVFAQHDDYLKSMAKLEEEVREENLRLAERAAQSAEIQSAVDQAVRSRLSYP